MRYLLSFLILAIPCSSMGDGNWVKYLECPEFDFSIESKAVFLKVKDPKAFQGKACVFVSKNEQACFQLLIGETTKLTGTDIEELIIDVFNPGQKECRYGI